MRPTAWRTRGVLMAALALAGVGLYAGRRPLWQWCVTGELSWPRSVADVLAEHGPRVEARYRATVEQAGLAWPPERLTLLAFKQERTLEVWAEGGVRRVRLAVFPVLGASGELGPKRREGDRQVPEGIYPLTTLNPQSGFHLSIRLDYPDAEDRRVLPGRPGSDIYIHGGRGSIGCLAMGDEVIEALFVLAALTLRRRVIIAPVDLRARDLPPELGRGEPWLAARYQRIREALARYR